MKIICDKTLLSAAIDGVSRAVTPRSTTPALEGILLKAEGFNLTLTGYDMELGIVTTIEANVLEAGDIVLNAKLLNDMVRRMPAGQISISVADNGKTTIQGGVAQFEIQSMPAADFPQLPNTGAEDTLTIKTGMFREMIERTLYAVSQDEKRPAHTGELFEIEPDRLTVVALDGFRLAIVDRNVKANKEIRIIVPGKTMNEVLRLLANDDEADVHISANRRYIVFNTAGYTIMSRLIEGEFLNYRNVIPEGFRTQAVLDTKGFIETIERASLIITERLKNPLRITFTEGKVIVRCQTSLGRVIVRVYVEVFRGTPMILQAVFIYYGLPYFTGTLVQWPSVFLAALLVVSINTGAYMAESVRGGFLSIDPGQTEGAKAIGMNHVQTMTSVILPQAIRNIIPQIGTNFIINIKDTSVMFIISFTEFFAVHRSITGLNLMYFPSATIEMIGYLCMTLLASFILRLIEHLLDGSANYELVQADRLTLAAGTYRHPSRKKRHAPKPPMTDEDRAVLKESMKNRNFSSRGDR